MDYQTKTDLILPFKGTLLVSNGGRTVETNNHYRPADQGPQNQFYAYDFRTENTGKEKILLRGRDVYILSYHGGSVK